MRYTDEELKEFGIVRTINAACRGRKDGIKYIYLCEECGREVARCNITTKPTRCDICKNNIKQKKRIQKKNYEYEAKMLEEMAGIDHIHEDRFCEACEILEEYNISKNAMRKASEQIQSFASIPEAIVAIVLSELGIEYKTQVKLTNNKRLDFYLTEYNIAMEIDGEIFHANSIRETEKDECIRDTFGRHIEIMHLPADVVRQKPIIFIDSMKKRFNK